MLPARPDYIMMMGYIIAFVYVANVISRPMALALLTTDDYQEIIEVCVVFVLIQDM